MEVDSKELTKRSCKPELIIAWLNPVTPYDVCS